MKFHRKINRSRSIARQSGFSLLEVILALAILGTSLVALGQLVRLGVDSASRARLETKAQFLCETKMEEIASGIELPESISRAPLYDNSAWLYSVDVVDGDMEGMLLVRILVEEDVALETRPVTFYLTRWIVDPEIEFLSSSDSSAESGLLGGGL